MAGSVSGRQERKSARGNRFAFVQLSDPSGLYEVTVFSDTLEAARDHLEPGKNIVLTVEATAEAEQLKLLARGAVPADDVANEAGQSGLMLYLEGPEAAGPVASILERAKSEGRRRGGPVSFCLRSADLPGEVEIALGGTYPITPQIKGALKSLPGVEDVVEV
jgi:DNA polymerase-3 subunit alpha